MNVFGDALRFKGTWRTYQRNVLDQADTYFEDKKYHIVAAPGSGKTTLGIELIRRLGAPCLILSPSITIRQQWLSRIAQGFLKDGEEESQWLSNTIKNPSKITSITYQALHSCISRNFEKLSQEDSEEPPEEAVDYSQFDIFSVLRENQVTTICLDEAHHLRSEWWKALETLLKNMKGITIISLTATPPYDSSPAEWKRYIDLCGTVDEEIFAPQLVKEKSLCPHQDYVYFNLPTKEEQKALVEFSRKARECMDSILSDARFIQVIGTHKGLLHPKESADSLLEKPDYFYALLCLWEEKKISFPVYLQRLMKVKKKHLPRVSLKMVDLILQGLLFEDTGSYAIENEYIESLKQFLKQYACIKRNTVCLSLDAASEKLLLSSKGKLDSIVTIAKEEMKSMGGALRLLVLTDFIKKEALARVGMPTEGVYEIGAVPIFEKLREEHINGALLGVLSGSVVIVPLSATEPAEKAFREIGCTISFKPISNTNYTLLQTSANNGQTVRVITELFQEGYINVLIGTKSLLGEGWDSPCINSLILASFVGSFMLSNQMRGRAIRTVPDNPEKASNIWHLVCIMPPRDKESERPEDSSDFLTLKRRFDTFLGVSYYDSFIESGVDRVGLSSPSFSKAFIEKKNKEAVSLSMNREGLRKKWENSLELIHSNFEIDDVAEIQRVQMQAGYLFFNSIKYFVFSFFVTLLCEFLRVGFPLTPRAIYYFLILLAIIFMGIAAVKLVTIFTPEKRIKKTGKAILSVLRKTGHIESGSRVDTETFGKNGPILLFLKGGSVRERTLFSASVAEFFGNVENPRYLLYNKKFFSGMNKYFVVPEVLGRKKEDAQALAEKLSLQAIYTRTPEGREALLKARVRSFSYWNEKVVNLKKKAKGKFE